MTFKNHDLHGNAPDKAGVALLLIDVINDLEFPEGEQLLEHARPMAQRLVELKRRAKNAHIPVVYVNDNFGRLQSNFKTHARLTLIVPGDCIASNTDRENRNALDQMARVLKADTRCSSDLDLEHLPRLYGENRT